MNLKTIILIFSVFMLFVIAGCSKPIAGQAISGFSDGGCVEGDWWYLDGEGNVQGPFMGCTEYDSAGQPWCATKTVYDQRAQKNFYFSGSKQSTAWQYCEKSSTGPVSCPGGTVCDGTPVTGTDGQVVCGTDLNQWKCTAAGWGADTNADGTQISCKCPVKKVFAVVACSGGTLCNGTAVTGTDGQVVCGTDLNNWKCTASGWGPDTYTNGTQIPCTCPVKVKEVEAKAVACSDTDNGMDYNVKGILTNPDGEKYTDFCVLSPNDAYAPTWAKPEDLKAVYEYYCNGEKAATSVQNCEGGCVDGACEKFLDPAVIPKIEPACTPASTGQKKCFKDNYGHSRYAEEVVNADCTKGPKMTQWGSVDGQWCGNKNDSCMDGKGCCPVNWNGEKQSCEGSLYVLPLLNNCTGVITSTKTDCNETVGSICYADSALRNKTMLGATCASCGKFVCEVTTKFTYGSYTYNVGDRAITDECSFLWPKDAGWKKVGEVTGAGC